MSSIKFSDAARADFARLYAFLAQYDQNMAGQALDAITAGIDHIEAHPLSGSQLEDRPNVRKSVVDFGATGYLVFHKRYERQDVNLVVRIIHQKEWYDEANIGMAQEQSQDALRVADKGQLPFAAQARSRVTGQTGAE